MNAGACTLMPDGEATTYYDPASGVRRPPTHDDWANATRLVDTMDEVGAYWRMVTSGIEGVGPGPAVAHWANTFGLFSKHVQDEIATETETAWLLELLAAIFGNREAVRRDHPFSVLYCPVSPLAMEAEHTDAYLATVGWDIPIHGLDSLALIAAGAPGDGPVAVAVTGGHGEIFVAQYDRPGLTPMGAVANLTPVAAAAVTDAALVFGSGAGALVEARGSGEAIDRLPSAADALKLPIALRSLPPSPLYARAPDARPPNLLPAAA